MKRLASLMIVAVLAACGSDNTGPTPRFDGVWVGHATDSLNEDFIFTMTATEKGSTISGTGVITEVGTDVLDDCTFTGSSTSSAVDLHFPIGPQPLSYTGTYVNSDSVSGVLLIGINNLPAVLGMKRQ